MNDLYEFEKTRLETTRTQFVVFTRSIRRLPQDTTSMAEIPIQNYLKPHPTKPSTYFLNMDFNPITEVQVMNQ